VAAVPLLLESVGPPGKREEIFALLAGTPEAEVFRGQKI
jgi:hypothetical protein